MSNEKDELNNPTLLVLVASAVRGAMSGAAHAIIGWLLDRLSN